VQLGPNGAVCIYGKERDSAENAVQTAALASLSQFANDMIAANNGDTKVDTVENLKPAAPSGSEHIPRSDIKSPGPVKSPVVRSGPGTPAAASPSPTAASSPTTSQQARSIVNKLKGIRS
jgi:hypothetical protein